MSSSQPLLHVSKLSMGYGKIPVLHEISLSIQEGEIFCVIGANGAGKTSLLLTLAGTYTPWNGYIEFRGEDITFHSPPARVKQGLVLVPEGRRIFPKLTVLENLLIGAYVRSDRAQVEEDIKKAYGLFPILEKRKGQVGGTLSGGEQQMLAIARALMSRPRMILMDEPSMGVAPLLVGKIFETIQELNRQGMTILLVEQNAQRALRIAHRAIVIEQGRVQCEDSGANLLNDPRVQEAYLGSV